MILVSTFSSGSDLVRMLSSRAFVVESDDGDVAGFAFTSQLVHMQLGESIPLLRDRIYGQASLAAG